MAGHSAHEGSLGGQARCRLTPLTLNATAAPNRMLCFMLMLTAWVHRPMHMGSAEADTHEASAHAVARRGQLLVYKSHVVDMDVRAIGSCGSTSKGMVKAWLGASVKAWLGASVADTISLWGLGPPSECTAVMRARWWSTGELLPPPLSLHSSAVVQLPTRLVPS
jgi:hypothetical protein